MTEEIGWKSSLVLPYSPYSSGRYAITQKDATYVHPNCWTFLGGNFFFDMRQKPKHDNSPRETMEREIMEEFGVAKEDKETLAAILGATSEAIKASDANFVPSQIPSWAAGFMAELGRQVVERLEPAEDYVIHVTGNYIGNKGKPARKYILSMYTAEVDEELFNTYVAMTALAKKRLAKLVTEGNGIFPVTREEAASIDLGWGQDKVLTHLLEMDRPVNDAVVVGNLGHAPLQSYDDYLQKYKDVFTFRGA